MSVASKNSLAALRADLVVSFVERHGRSLAVIKDPVGHRFFEFQRADYDWACRLRPELTLRQAVTRIRREFLEQTASLDDQAIARRLLRISAELRAHGLAAGTLQPQADRGAESPLREWMRGVRKISSVLFLRVKLCDPTWLLDRCGPWFGIFFRPWFLWVSTAVFLISAGLFIGNGGLGKFEAGWFASPASLIGFYLGLMLLKTLHEAAHAIAVRRYGGSVHEAGMMLVAGLPLFYVEASDSYLFPKKSQRIAVAAAGIVAELLIAGLLVWIWLPMAEGFTRQLLLNLILIASVSTVLFNGNPLMRFDGYYILADALDMPGLRQRSREFMSGEIMRALLGGEPSMRVSKREGWILRLYGICSYLYLIVVLLAIWGFLSAALEPYGLKWISDLLIGSWALGSLVFPTLSFIRKLVATAAHSESGRRRRAMLVASCALGLITLILCIPIPHWVERSCALEASQAMLVRAEEQGFVSEVLVKEGDPVASGQPLARLTNRELENNLKKAASTLAQAEAKLHSSIASGAASEVGVARSEIASSSTRLEALKSRSGRLSLKSPAAGVVGSRKLADLVGRQLKPGELFCVIRPETLSEFLIPLREKEARLVRAGDRVRLRVLAFADHAYQGFVLSDPLRMKGANLPSLGKELAKNAAGQPLEDTHFAVVRVEDPDQALRIGMTGRVRILCGTRSIGETLWDQFLDFIRLDLRMR